MFNKRILGILPISIGGRLTTSSIIDGFRQNGCEVVVFDELFDNDFQEIIKYKFDYILGYDFSGIKIKVDNNLQIPSISYFSDEIRSKASGPEWEKYLPELSKEENYVFYWDRELAKEENFPNLYYMPHFVNFDIYKDMHIEPQIDIMFAGRLDTDYRLSLLEELVSELPELKFGWYAIERHYKDARQRAKIPLIIDCSYKGFIDNELDMAKAINNSKIVFNMNSQGISSLNYRTMQTVACKRLLISDYRDELDLFDGEMPYYEDISDLVFKIETYLEDEKAYNKVVNNCYNIAEKKYNSKKCVYDIIKKLCR